MILLFSFLLMKVCSVTAQNHNASVSGLIKDHVSKEPVPFANIVIKNATDQKFIAGTVTSEDGRFTIPNITSGNYLLEITSIGFKTKTQKLFVGSLSDYLDLNTIEIEQDINNLTEVVVTAKSSNSGTQIDKKVFSVADNIAQSGGSVLQSMQSLPGITTNEGKIQLRGNDKVMIL
ncbi:MAG TPA: carboxypeptidase-like regulatory domain-containing protein, partial [Flavobacterium sp.]|nr:carboxypeptidase-like regulatory domain-containing protein [Flavobacterium sp.]